MAYLDGKVNSFKDQDVRQVLAQLAAVADRTGACIVFVRHLNKSGGPNPLYRGGGSIGIIGAVRAGFVIANDPDDDNGDRRVLACVKSNLAPMPPALSYVLEQDPAQTVARVSWRGTSKHSASDIRRDRDDPVAAERDEAVAWLVDYLTDEGGSANASDAIRDAAKVGISKATLTRARQRAGVSSHKTGMKGARWSMTRAKTAASTGPSAAAPLSPWEVRDCRGPRCTTPC